MGQREKKSTILLIQIITNLTKKNKNYTNTINKTLHKYKTFQCFFMCCNPNFELVIQIIANFIV